MKNTRNNYSIVDAMPDMFKEELNESMDALALFKAMDGMGTDEETIETIFAKRGSDLRALDAEYAKLMQVKGEKDTSLVSWLEGDGMDDQAAMIQTAPLVTSTPAAAAPAPTTPGFAAGVTAPEITMPSQVPAGSKQNPDGTFTLPDGRVTGKLISESAGLSIGSLIRNRWGRY